jgi:hypothetical protein
MNGTWEMRMPGGIEFVPVPDDGTGRVIERKDLSILLAPMGAPGAAYRFRSNTGAVSLSTRISSDFPALGRGLDG